MVWKTHKKRKEFLSLPEISTPKLLNGAWQWLTLRQVLKMAARLGLSVTNTNFQTTFCEEWSQDHPGIWSVAHDLVDWKLTNNYTSSDYQYITYRLLKRHQITCSTHLGGIKASWMKGLSCGWLRELQFWKGQGLPGDGKIHNAPHQPEHQYLNAL